MKISRCKGCGRGIVWATKEDGGKVPLDASAPVYAVTEVGDEIAGGAEAVVLAKRAERHLVSHFATCPQASEFSGRSRGRKT
ncbi:MAG: hypothetical protein IT458_08435 [Planctomycetes bacterium]|nr:hypothetical protein [Planctomycetota bacterium]